MYRSAKACLAIEKLEEAEDAIARAIALDSKNSTFKNLRVEIEKRKEILDARNKEAAAAVKRKREAEHTLKIALQASLPTILLTKRIGK